MQDDDFTIGPLRASLQVVMHEAIGAEMAIVAEAALRMVLAGVLVVATASPSLPWATAVIVIGCYGWLPLAVPVLRSVSRDEGRVSWGAAAHTVTALGCANALSALVLTAFPTLVTAVVGSASSLATLFVVVTLARLPLPIFITTNPGNLLTDALREVEVEDGGSNCRYRIHIPK